MAKPTARILIVDDNKVNRLLMSRNVEMLGYHASVAENGRVAMDSLRLNAFDLLLLDIEMPEMDGFEVLEAIKADPALPRIDPAALARLAAGERELVRTHLRRCGDDDALDHFPTLSR